MTHLGLIMKSCLSNKKPCYHKKTTREQEPGSSQTRGHPQGQGQASAGRCSGTGRQGFYRRSDHAAFNPPPRRAGPPETPQQGAGESVEEA